MLIDLDNNLYVIDSKTHEHKIVSIDTINKIVYVERTDDCVGYDFIGELTIAGRNTATSHAETKTIEVYGYYYGTHDITVTIK